MMIDRVSPRGVRPLHSFKVDSVGTILGPPPVNGGLEPVSGRHRHPRVRGEHGLPNGERRALEGPPPRARGACDCADRDQNHMGTTPACAGSMGMTCRCPTWCRDHPRVRGEHDNFPCLVRVSGGPPPRARGAYSLTCSSEDQKLYFRSLASVYRGAEFLQPAVASNQLVCRPSSHLWTRFGLERARRATGDHECASQCWSRPPRPVRLLRVARDEDEGVTQDEHERGGLRARGDAAVFTLPVRYVDGCWVGDRQTGPLVDAC